MKRYYYYFGGIVFVISICFFCYSCMTEKDSSQETPDQATKTAFNPEIAGIGHNQCLDIFYGKLQQVKLNKTRADELSSDDVELEEAIIESLVECLQNLDIDADVKEEIQTELFAIIEYCDQNSDEEIRIPDRSEQAQTLDNQLQAIVNTDYADAVSAINAITNIEITAKQTLPESEYNCFLISTSIARHSLEYWYDNYSTWFPKQTRSGNNWKRVANADCQSVIQHALIHRIATGSAFIRYSLHALRIASWKAQLIIFTCLAAADSLEEALNEEIATDEIDLEEMESDLSCKVAEKAIRIFLISNDSDDEEESEMEN